MTFEILLESCSFRVVAEGCGHFNLPRGDGFRASCFSAIVFGKARFQAELQYGGGLRLSEVVRLRVKEIDPEREQTTVRAGKGDRDRTTVLPKRGALARKMWRAGERCGR